MWDIGEMMELWDPRRLGTDSIASRDGCKQGVSHVSIGVSFPQKTIIQVAFSTSSYWRSRRALWSATRRAKTYWWLPLTWEKPSLSPQRPAKTRWCKGMIFFCFTAWCFGSEGSLFENLISQDCNIIYFNIQRVRCIYFHFSLLRSNLNTKKNDVCSVLPSQNFPQAASQTALQLALSSGFVGSDAATAAAAHGVSCRFLWTTNDPLNDVASVQWPQWRLENSPQKFGGCKTFWEKIHVIYYV